MSHFTVLVVQQPGKTVDEMMAPFHQFECTGTDDEFVQDIDETEEVKKAYAEKTKRIFVAPDGHSEVDAYDDQFYRDCTPEELDEIGPIAGMGWGRGKHWNSKDWGDGRGYRTKMHYLPEGWTEKDKPMEEHQSFLEFVTNYHGVKIAKSVNELGEEHKYGYALLNTQGEVEKIVNRTNPNYKWDWFTVGGRWSGMYELKPFASGALGQRSLLDRGPDDRPANSADAMLKGDIDWEGMRGRREAEVRKRWGQIHEYIDGQDPILSFQDMLKTVFVEKGLSAEPKDWTDAHHDARDEARTRYWAQDGMKILQEAGKQNKELESLVHWGLEKYLTNDIEKLVKEERAEVGITHSLLIDGKWYEADEVGMWGAGTDISEKPEWRDKFWELLNEVPDDTPLFLIDCHI